MYKWKLFCQKHNNNNKTKPKQTNKKFRLETENQKESKLSNLLQTSSSKSSSSLKGGKK